MKLHGHPQKATFDSPAEWPPIDSQIWVGDPDPIQAGHIHVVPTFPLYAEITDITATIDVPFTLKAHNIAGVIGAFYGEHIRSVRWNDTGSALMPVMRGDPHGLKEWSGVATVDFTLGDDGFLHIFQFPQHGWAEVRFFARTSLDNGDVLDVICVVPVYSLVDPSAPIKPAAEQGNPGVHIRTSCVLWRNNQAIAGEVITEISDYIPLGPIDTPWTTIANAYNYTAPAGVAVADQVLEQRLDPDLHHGIPGTIQRHVVVGPAANKQFLGTITIDPATMGAGAHKTMVTWTQPLGVESTSAVIVFPVTVGSAVPPPPPPETVPAPNVVGLTQVNAAAALRAAGLVLGMVMTAPDAVIAAGAIVSQDPAAGVLVARGNGVMITLSTGPVVVDPPPTGEAWVVRVPTFMQLEINGVPQDRWQICDPNEPMVLGVSCPEIVTKP